MILGPTGSGKTALALAVARRFHGEIVNCDSVAMYRDFEIGTAKPTVAERAEIKHYLVDCVDPLEDVTAGEFARQAREILHDIAASKERVLPIVSGGTGLYLRALLDGLFPGPQRSEELRDRLRARANQRGSEYLRRILCKLDPEAAARIHANDSPKLIRAIEVCLLQDPETRENPTRKTMTDLWREGREPLRGFRIRKLGLNPPREKLYARINARAERMFADGLIEETELLLAKYGDRARPLASLGYKQVLQVLRGEIDRPTAIAAAQQAHRNYAKRQMTWFRREPDVRWLEAFGDDSTIQSKAIELVETER